MRYALLADVHANLEALRAVLTDLETWPGATLVVAGDLVGYGPDPDACIALLAARGARCVAGNHEGMILGRLPLDRCVHAGIRAAAWTARTLAPASRDYLAALPSTLELEPDLLVFHGSPVDPEEYVTSSRRAEAALALAAERWPRARLLVCGHTHRPAVYRPGGSFTTPRGELRLDAASRWLVNPGAVGQTRDGVPLARYARYDSEQGVLEVRELVYDWPRTIEKLRGAGLVPRVSLPPSRGLQKRVDALRTSWERRRAGRLLASTDP